MIEKCYNKTQNKALRDGNLKGLLITTNCKELAMTTANDTRNIARGQSSKSQLTYGVGFDSKRRHVACIGSKHTKPYQTWIDMLKRCYCPKFQRKFPTYIGCTVDERFHDFQDFADWFYRQPYNDIGYQLDKDLLIPNNKVYSPGICCFIPQELNKLLTNRKLARGDYPQGVYYNKPTSKYLAGMKYNGKSKHLGLFECPQEAHQAYKIAKEAYVKEKALEWQDRIDDNVFQALMNWTLDS